MQIDTAHMLYQALGSDRSAWVFAGAFRDEHTADLIQLGEAFADRADSGRDVRNRLAYVMVEAFQNVVRHGVALDATSKGTMLLRDCGNGFEVVTTNQVGAEDGTKLRAAMEHLAGLGKDELKSLFLERLQGNKVSERGGAGLGLIEMARRSNAGLRHTITANDGAEGAFGLAVSIAAKDTMGCVPLDLSPQGWSALLGKHRVLSAYRGNMNAGIQQVVLRMLEKGADGDAVRGNIHMRAWLSATELVESLLGPDSQEVVLVLGHGSEGDRMAIGMYMAAAEAEKLDLAVKEANNLSPFEQTRRYREVLLEKAQGGMPVALPLMDFLRTGGGKLDMMRCGTSERVFVSLGLNV